jgi:hypothetical protein
MSEFISEEERADRCAKINALVAEIEKRAELMRRDVDGEIASGKDVKARAGAVNALKLEHGTTDDALARAREVQKRIAQVKEEIEVVAVEAVRAEKAEVTEAEKEVAVEQAAEAVDAKS